MRLDMTEEEELQMQDGYYRCLVAHGVKMTQNAQGHYEWTGPESKQKSEDPKVKRACAEAEPLPPPEQDPAKNPYLADDEDHYWQCLKDHGDDVHRASGGGWEPGPHWGEIPNATAVDRQCKVTAFNGKKG
ncbi:hypothetical protein KRMM14A1259_05800 [Krasilnikovia sp. MM14-A1259]